MLAVGDAEFQRRCLGRMDDLSESGRTIVFVSHQMQAVAQLCERVILLEKGSVVARRTERRRRRPVPADRRGLGSTRAWADLESAPGDDLVRLRSLRVVDESGDVVDAVDVRRAVGVEIGFTVLRSDGPPIFPKIKVYDARQNVLFNAMDTSSRWHERSISGEYVSTAWIPGNLLNEGLAMVDVGIFSLGAPKLHPHCNYGAVSFHVQDPGEGDSAKGFFTGQWNGVVRPLLEWTTEER